MKFEDIHICKDERFSLGREATTGKYYISIPVSNSLVDYEEFYEISKSDFEDYPNNHSKLANLAEKCRHRQNDNNLLIQPGRDRGVA